MLATHLRTSISTRLVMLVASGGTAIASGQTHVLQQVELEIDSTRTVAALGDVNGDGVPDVLAGESLLGRVRVHSGVSGGVLLELSAPVGASDFGQAYKVLSIPLVPHAAFCSALVNSTGGPASLQATGQGSVIGNDLVLRIEGAPAAAATTIFFFGTSENASPLGDGRLCAGGPYLRLSGALATGAAGTVEHAVDLTGVWLGGHLTVGATIYCQGWFRDVTPGGSNLPSGLRIHTVY